MSRAVKQPVVLVKWFRVVVWVLDRVDHFPKNQRFVFGQRLADRAISVLELLVEASWSREKPRLLAAANRDIEVLRWLVRLAHERKLLTGKQYQSAAFGLEECGRMVGGWQKHALSQVHRPRPLQNAGEKEGR